MKQKALIFGSNGTIGSYIYDDLINQKYEIFTAGKLNKNNSINHISIDYNCEFDKDIFINLPEIDVIIWSQGLNCSDSIENFELKDINNLINSNLIFIAYCINQLMKSKKIKRFARLVIISSIWQKESRRNKFSYSVSKSALVGLIKSAAIDLGSKNILINAILPGVIDSPMTRLHLSERQINHVIRETALKRLPTCEDIANAVRFLASPLNKSITGQSIVVDGGFLGLKNNL